MELAAVRKFPLRLPACLPAWAATISFSSITLPVPCPQPFHTGTHLRSTVRQDPTIAASREIFHYVDSRWWMETPPIGIRSPSEERPNCYVFGLGRYCRMVCVRVRTVLCIAGVGR
ncbi:hypothetical protein LY76DRAFT_42096 [Colletotrichum caudatum]|nr:hypothetical protein LY76DRAFT_42096 [Colletotrichum caudatum]